MSNDYNFVSIATGVHRNGTPFIVATGGDGIAYISHCRVVDDRGYFDSWQALPEHPAKHTIAIIQQSMPNAPVAAPIAETVKPHWLAEVWRPFNGNSGRKQ